MNAERIQRWESVLSEPGRDELRNIMRGEPVHPTKVLSAETIFELSTRGLIMMEQGCWVVDWNKLMRGFNGA